MTGTRAPESGPAVHPFVRLVGGSLLMVSCLLLRTGSRAGTVALLGLGLIALLLNRPSGVRIAGILGAGTVLYAPLFFFMPPEYVLKGLTAAVIALSTVSSLGVRNLHDGILHLPLPGLVRLLLLQIVHQAEILGRESRRIHQALAVRGGIRGIRAQWLFVRSFPLVWLPRVLFKAHRVAMAMDVREYGDQVPAADPVRWGREEGVFFGLCSAVSLATLFISFAVPA